MDPVQKQAEVIAVSDKYYYLRLPKTQDVDSANLANLSFTFDPSLSVDKIPTEIKQRVSDLSFSVQATNAAKSLCKNMLEMKFDEFTVEKLATCFIDDKSISIDWPKRFRGVGIAGLSEILAFLVHTEVLPETLVRKAILACNDYPKKRIERMESFEGFLSDNKARDADATK